MAFICKSCARRLYYTKPLNRKGITTAASTTNTTTLHPPLPLKPHPASSFSPSVSKPQISPASRQQAPNIPPAALSYYWDTQPPGPHQLSSASRFFITQPPTLLYTASQFRTIPTTSAPEVAFLGRSNVGKSSLLNALLGKKICYTSRKPGRTRVMNGFGIGGDGEKKMRLGDGGTVAMGEVKMIVMDMPGYGKGGRAEWGKEILKYLVGRKQLRRAFLLIDATHGIKKTDEQLLAILRQNAIPHQIIVSKVDKLILPDSRIPSAEKTERKLTALRGILEGMKHVVQPGSEEGPGALGEILTCSAEKSVERGKKLGIDGVRWAVLSAAGLESYSSTRSKVTTISSSEEQEMDHEYP